MRNNHSQQPFRRRAAAAATVAVSGTVLIGMAALAIDMGMLYATRAEMQRTADAGALAGAWGLLGDERFISGGMSTLVARSRQSASSLAGANEVFGSSPVVDNNACNAADGDILIGQIVNPSDQSSPLLSAVDASLYNSVQVKVRRDEVRNGSIPLYFAQVFGVTSTDMSATATATADDAITGFKITERSGNAQLLPFAVHVSVWQNLLDRTQTTGDNYSYDPDTGAVSTGSDGVYELNMYPGGGNGNNNNNTGNGSQLAPGNFGTVDIGNPNNSTADISRQILEGVNESDLSYFGGELAFDANGELVLNGDTGLSAAVKDDLEAIKGQPRAIPLFTQVSGNGNNANFTIVAFAGIRVLHVKLTGPMSKKAVIVQPAVLVDDAATTGEVTGTSYGVYRPPMIVR